MDGLLNIFPLIQVCSSNVSVLSSLGALRTVEEGAVAVDGDRVRPSDVGAYWLQGKLGEYYKDAVTSQKVADQVLAILKVCLCCLSFHLLA